MANNSWQTIKANTFVFISTVAATHNGTEVHHFSKTHSNSIISCIRGRHFRVVWSSNMAAAVINFINDVTCNGSIQQPQTGSDQVWHTQKIIHMGYVSLVSFPKKSICQVQQQIIYYVHTSCNYILHRPHVQSLDESLLPRAHAQGVK